MWRFFVKKFQLILAMISLLGLVANMSLAANIQNPPVTYQPLATSIQGLPADFRHYFYESELVVQVYLNDSSLFDATISLKDNGDVRLIHIINEPQEINQDLKHTWMNILQQGVSIGKCTKFCPSGLMAVEYRLDNSTLKLYTAQYETSQIKSTYTPMPDKAPKGIIMYNDVSAVGTAASKSWGINSSLLSSFAGWNQKVSFQSSGNYGRNHYSNSSLYELFSQKEFPGSFIRLGLFSPDNDTSNVQTSGFGYDTVAGAMWGTSDTLLVNTDNVSVWPVYITGRNQSIAEVWRDGRLIYTQQIQSGVQALDTRQLPNGIYDIMIKIIEDGRIIDTQRAQIYKPQGWTNPNNRWRMNLWTGQHTTLATKNDSIMHKNNSFAVGGGLDILAHPRAILGLSAIGAENEYQIRTNANITLSPGDTLFVQHTLGNKQHRSSKSTDIRYYHNLPAGLGSASLFWRSSNFHRHHRSRTKSRESYNTLGTSLSLQLSRFTSLLINNQYTDTSYRRGFGSDLSATTLTNLSGYDINFRLSAYNQPSFNKKHRDHGISFGVSIALAPVGHHTISAETGINQNQGYSSLSYHWQPEEDSSIHSLGGSIIHSQNNTVVSGNGAINTPYFSSDFYMQHNIYSNTNTVGGNLSQVLVMGGGKVSAVNGSNTHSIESAMIVDVDADDDKTRIVASSDMAESLLVPGRNVIPTALWKKNHIQFIPQSGQSIQISPDRQSVHMIRGSVQYLKIKAVKSITLVGMLQNEQGHVVKNRYVSSDIASSVINAEGVLTVDTSITNQLLTVRAENNQPALQCKLPPGLNQNKRVLFVSAISCQTVGLREEK